MDRSLEALFSQAIVRSLHNWGDNYYGRFRICFGGLCHGVIAQGDKPMELMVADSGHCQIGKGKETLRADPNQMPFQSGSVDLLILPLTLEMCATPERVIREAERVIADDGRLVLYGINPWSVWNLLRRLSGGSDDLPRRQQQLSRRRVKEWLLLLGFDIERQTSLLYGLPQELPRDERRADRLGRQFLPGCGVLYGIQAVKRVAPVSMTKVAMKRFRIANAEPVGSWQLTGVMKKDSWDKM